MLLAFPVETDKGLESEIYGNFGDASGFVLFDNKTKEHRYIKNSHYCGKPNECEPMQAFGQEQVNVVIISGIGGTAEKTSGGRSTGYSCKYRKYC